MKRYSKTASISQHVKDIIEEKLASTIPDENIDNTSNEYGFIKFGSRVDLYLPLETKINVKLNDKVKAGQSTIANY